MSFVSVFGLVLAWIAAGAYKRTQNKKLLYLPIAFALFFLKAVAVAGFIFADQLGSSAFAPHELEWGILANTLLDLLVIVLLVLPILLRAPRAPVTPAEPGED